MQSSTWARIRERQGWRPEFVRIGESLPVALVLWRNALPGRPIGYVPRGPVVAPGDTVGLRTALDRLASLARERNATFIKVDPELTAAEAEPGLREAGYRRAADIQPVVATLQLDLRADEDTLFGALEKDTRWSVRQATKRGVRIVGAIAIDDGLPRDFYDLYATTGKRAGFITRAWSYYEETWGWLIADGLASLLVAYVGDEAVAGAMVWRCGDRALYQTAATNEAGRKSHAAYALLWQSIIEAKRAGRTVFDMGGIPKDLDRKDDPMYGPYLFKRGFGGKEVRWVGAHDTVPGTLAYRAYLLAEPAYTTALRLVGRVRR